MRRRFQRDLGALEDVFDCLHAFLAEQPAGDRVRFAVDLAVEEVFTNMVKYNEEGPDGIWISLERGPGCVTIALEDPDSDPFDPLERTDVDVTQDVGDRPVGGLGLHLVKHLMDEFRYDYTNRVSRITLVKRFDENYAGD